MYSSYASFIENLNSTNDFNFKSNGRYNSILEHVSYNQGKEYLNLITEMFPEITLNQINDYLLLNDKFGSPKKETFIYNNVTIICSPTSLRYVLHSLIILAHFKDAKLDKIVEVGCGYGGLFLAINYFSKLLDIQINKYYLIDLPEICELIKKYNNMNSNDIHIDYSILSSYNYGEEIDKNELFFISNYCFTEIEDSHRNNYITHLFPKVKNGFIIWQTIFNLPIKNVNMIGKSVLKIKEETPQTATQEYKNYYVYF